MVFEKFCTTTRTSTNVGNNNLALAERRIELLHLFTDSLVISTDGTVVVDHLVDHVAGQYALGGMHQMDVATVGFDALLEQGTDVGVDGAGAYG